MRRCPSGTVVQVVQAGYMIGERVLRPALVGVSKGGAKAAPAAVRATKLESSRDIRRDWIRLTPALVMSAQAFASEPCVSMPRQASSTT